MDTTAFLQRHFADLRDGELIEIRCVFKDDSQPVCRKYFVDPEKAAAWALAKNAEGYHAYYGANPRSYQAVKDGLRGKEAVARVTHVWADIDCHGDSAALAAAANRLNVALLMPDIVVSTGGGYQALWPLIETHNDTAWAEQILQRLAFAYEGDPAVAEVARILRLPGTTNHKASYPAGTVATVVEHHDHRYHRNFLDRALPDMPPPSSTPPPPADINAAEFLDALQSIDPWSVSYDEWLRILMAVHAYEPCYLDHAVAWAKGKPGEVEAKWKSFRREGSNPATVFHFARQAGWRSSPNWRPPTKSTFVPLDLGDDPTAAVARRQPPRIAVTRLDDFLAEVDTPPTWVVDNFLHAGGLSLLVAPPKAGKSTYCANLAVAVGAGVPFLGRATRRGLVHVYSLEVVRDWVRQQYRQLVAAHRLAAPPEIALHASTGVVEGALEQIAEAVMRDRPALVIIDTLAKAIPIADGNNYHEVYKAMQPMMELAEASGAHIVCVHHTNKGLAEGTSAVMGSVAFAASVDLTVMIRRDREADLRTLEVEARFLPEQAPLAFDFDEERRIVLLGDRDRVLRESAEARILAYVAAEPGATAADIQQATGLPREIAGPALFRLAQVMRLQAEGSPKRYSMVEYHKPADSLTNATNQLEF